MHKQKKRDIIENEHKGTNTRGRFYRVLKLGNAKLTDTTEPSPCVLVGGIAGGTTSADIQNCLNVGKVSSGYHIAGGAGSRSIKNCFAYKTDEFNANIGGEDLTKPVTRLEFAAISVKVYENLAGTAALPSTVNPFEDCKDIEMLKAYNLGITVGVSKTQFNPSGLLNREMAATMLTRVFKRSTMPGWNMEKDSEFPLVYAATGKFADDALISDWAKESVYFMNANKIILGINGNLFAPKNITDEEEANGYANATREQALLIAVRMVEGLK